MADVLELRHGVLDTALGPLTAVVDDAGLAGLFYPGHWTRPDESRWGPRVDPADDAVLPLVHAQLADYLAGRRRDLDLLRSPALTARATPAARALWALLDDIPYGSTTTYGTLARALGGTVSARAVGGYVGHNPLSIVVPCHRVVGSDGTLTGYAGGLDRKRALLELEGAIPAAAPALF